MRCLELILSRKKSATHRTTSSRLSSLPYGAFSCQRLKDRCSCVVAHELCFHTTCLWWHDSSIGCTRYKGKAIITGVLLKQVCARWVTTYDVAMWIKPYFGTTLATILWDGMTCHSIMKAAKLRAIGVTTTIEVFNEIIDTFFPGYVANPALLSEKARLQLLRAIGIAIVKKGSMFPTMELLLRHSSK